MFEDLQGLGMGLVVFAIIIGVGSVVLYNFGGTMAVCTGSTCGTAGVWNATSGVCSNATSSSCLATPTGQAYTNTNYLLTQLGTTGLAGWTPAIIAIAVGMLFLGAFMIGNAKKGRY
jgi:hypothetical protein